MPGWQSVVHGPTLRKFVDVKGLGPRAAEERKDGKDCCDLHNLSSTGIWITRDYIFREKK